MIPAFIAIIMFGKDLLQIFGEQYSHNSYLLLLSYVLGGFPYSFNSLFISVKRVKKDIRMIVLVHASVAIVYLSASYLFISLISRRN